MAKILVVDDESPIVELLRFNLGKEGYQVITATSGPEALEKAREDPDLVILDLMLPGLDGLEVCRQMRAEASTARVPVIMLTAKTQEADKVVGLEIGADDYVTKPFSPRELVARVKAALRRAAMEGKDEPDVIQAGPVVLRSGRYEVHIGDRCQSLTPKEFELLRYLILNAGKVLKRDYLLDKVWGYDYAADTRTVDVHIRYLRQKIEDDPSNPKYIETVRGVGYRFRELA